jgi:hypothetical protein
MRAPPRPIYDPSSEGGAARKDVTPWVGWAAAAVVAAVAAGCGGNGDPPPAACSAGARAVLGALQRAPDNVALEDGTLISTCVERSLDTGEMQTLGFTYVAVANSELKRMADSNAAALRLGFLVGAVRRGAKRTNGVQLELVRRLDQVAGVGGPPGPRRAAYRRGVAAGEDHG